MTVSPTEDEYRKALYAAQRGLLHALKWMNTSVGAVVLVNNALMEVNEVLDIGRDEKNEQIAT